MSVERQKSGSGPWLTVEATGGGSLPDWWTVDSTPGSEKFTMTSGATAGDEAQILSVVQGDAKEILYLDSGGNLQLVWASAGDGGFAVTDETDTNRFQLLGFGSASDTLLLRGRPGQTHPLSKIDTGDGDTVFAVGPTGAVTISPGASTTLEVDEDAIGFFGATPAAQPTGVAVTAGGIHAALVTLGLIAA